mmetsp:Transcript_4391/g.9520  ORF Transcript_4391/g.9520 Transcript_4391/m.9520 type:complete len:618 (+) Transcript_4391:98-1951(+)
MAVLRVVDALLLLVAGSRFWASASPSAPESASTCQAGAASCAEEADSSSLLQRSPGRNNLKAEDTPVVLLDAATSAARARARVRLRIEGNLATLSASHYRAWRHNETCQENAEQAFQHFVSSVRIGPELSSIETAAYRKRVVEETLFDCKHHLESPSQWLQDLRLALEQEKPIFTLAIAEAINGAGLSFQTVMQPWMVNESMRTFSARLGKQASPEENHTMFVATQAYYSERRGERGTKLPANFDSRKKWPECAETIGRIHQQGKCGSCWAFGAGSALDSRLCIATGGAVSGEKAMMSRGYAVSCARPNVDGCKGGLARYLYRLAAGTGLPTGGYGSDGCSPYFGFGEGTDHFTSSSAAPPCPDQCRPRYPRDLLADKFAIPGLSSYREIWPTNAQGNADAKQAMYQYGPMSFGIHANTPFMGYSSGIFDASCGANPNHEVTGIGWGDSGGKNYWIGLNSWGPYWGMEGRFYAADCIVTDWTVPGPFTDVSNLPLPLPGEKGSVMPETMPSEPAKFTVTGPCKIDAENCVTSPDYPEPYANKTFCRIPKEFGRIHVVSFGTEIGSDIMTVNGHDFAGSTGPHGVTPTGDITWTSDDDVTGDGWKICPPAKASLRERP